MLDEKEKKINMLLIDGAEEEKINLLKKKEIIRIDSMRIEMQKIIDLLVLKKN